MTWLRMKSTLETIHYLNLAIKALNHTLGPVASNELAQTKATLAEFEALRKQWLQPPSQDEGPKLGGNKERRMSNS